VLIDRARDLHVALRDAVADHGLADCHCMFRRYGASTVGSAVWRMPSRSMSFTGARGRFTADLGELDHQAGQLRVEVGEQPRMHQRIVVASMPGTRWPV